MALVACPGCGSKSEVGTADARCPYCGGPVEPTPPPAPAAPRAPSGASTDALRDALRQHAAAGAGRGLLQAVRTTWTVNGVTYASLDEMPEDVRAIAESVGRDASRGDALKDVLRGGDGRATPAAGLRASGAPPVAPVRATSRGCTVGVGVLALLVATVTALGALAAGAAPAQPSSSTSASSAAGGSR